MGKNARGVATGLGVCAVLFGALFGLIALKAPPGAVDARSFVVLVPGLLGTGFAVLIWVERKVGRERLAAQALKPVDVVFFNDP